MGLIAQQISDILQMNLMLTLENNSTDAPPVGWHILWTSTS